MKLILELQKFFETIDIIFVRCVIVYVMFGTTLIVHCFGSFEINKIMNGLL